MLFSALKDQLQLIACPQCRNSLVRSTNSMHCRHCDVDFPMTAAGVVDLRPVAPLTRSAMHTLFPPQQSGNEETEFGELHPCEAPEVSFDSINLPRHLSDAMASYIPRATSDRCCALDLGCGTGAYREAIEHAGYHWIGCDYQHPAAPILADAHALPFQSDSIDFVLSLAVLEHLRQPTIALREIRRVMKPGASFLGSVTYLTPFHDAASYFNMTHEGVREALIDAGFTVKLVAGERKYMGLHAISYNGLFLDAPRSLAYGIAWPLLALSRCWWQYRRFRKLGRSSRQMEILMNTGAFVFLAQNPAAESAFGAVASE